jgi:hypothetical protein
MYAEIYGLRIMAVLAIEVAALEEYDGPVSRSVYEA